MKPLSILIADHHTHFTEEMKQQFNRSSLPSTIHTVHDGLSCLQFIQKDSPDILILDFLLPVMDGFSVLKKVSDHSPLPFTVLVTAFYSEDIHSQADERGVAKTFLKPVLFEEIEKELIDQLPVILRQTHEETVVHLLRKIGIPLHVKGYYYMKDTLLYLIHHKNEMISVHKDVYPMVARAHQTTPLLVDRCIGNAISIAWKNGSFHEHFSFKQKPSNVKLLAELLFHIHQKS